MLSVFLDCGPEDEALALSLAALVPGAVDGLVREVVLFDRGMEAGARRVADHAGCRVADGAAFRASIEGSRGEWLLFLEPGARLKTGWIEAVVEHVERVGLGRGRVPAARFSPARGDRPGFLKRLVGGRRALGDGLLLPKAQAIGLARTARDLETAARGVAAERLGAEIRPRAR
ncbi:hypothetical protein [Aurantimonas sp. Leaf443]|uniref:hypothetical protein n=1 Tax=Aurantimonas sp. Leaf443 TaxID=1736378 RepID=UPI0006F52BC8|nr:hypothetical protein [Aurantimonas sp. Leaf443]KQT88027.1 hypothetical protein ASG48_00810 [Aurantimonas sp. Leaf443]